MYCRSSLYLLCIPINHLQSFDIVVKVFFGMYHPTLSSTFRGQASVRIYTASRDCGQFGVRVLLMASSSLSLDLVLAGFLCPVARLVFDLLAAPVSLSLRRPRSSLRSSPLSYSSSIATPIHWSPRHAFTILAHFRSSVYDYTSGRWM